MIQPQTILKIVDNSGAKTIKCIKVLGGYKKKVAFIGDIIIASVQELRNKYKINSKVKKGEVVSALILRTKKNKKRKDGTFFSFDKNCAILINKSDKPLGTRIFGSVPKEFRVNKFMKLASIGLGFI
jgi:large subunit ribosomal protein L14